MNYRCFYCRGPNFELMASATLCLDDTNDNIRTHDLKIENTGLYFVSLPKRHFIFKIRKGREPKKKKPTKKTSYNDNLKSAAVVRARALF